MSDADDDAPELELVEEPPEIPQAQVVEQQVHHYHHYEEEQDDEPQAQAPPPKKSCCGGKCCLLGCIGFVVLSALSVVGVIFGIPYGARWFRDTYTGAEPTALPQVTVTQAQVAELQTRFQAFEAAVQTPGAPAVLVLTADDINRMIAEEKRKTPSPEQVYVEIQDGRITARITVPFDAMSTSEDDRKVFEQLGLKGRHLNAGVTFTLAVANGRLAVELKEVIANGKRLPGIFVSLLRKALKSGIEKGLTESPDAQQSLRQLESVEVKDDRILIKAKGGQPADGDFPSKAQPRPDFPSKAAPRPKVGDEEW